MVLAADPSPADRPWHHGTISLRRSLVVLVLAGFLFIVISAAQAIWGVGFGPAAPAGATRLHLATDAPVLSPFSCALALLAPIRIGSTATDLIVLNAATGAPEKVAWPSGYAAFRDGGRAVLIAREGTVLGREGDVLSDLGGGVSDDGTFHVCR